ncbi:hypothetical protein BY996DRAFT_410198 [Phakopsora pachyrhizi]|nr:hypothetical protein BY996DRAFT_410198 [Phakopsora pachyrhizi]
MNDGIVGVDSAIYNSSSMVNSNYGSKVIFDQLEPINRRRGRRGTIESLRSISRTLTRFRSSINSTANSTTVIQRLFSLLRQHSNHLNQINRSVGLIDSVSSKLSIYANSSSNGQQQQQRSTAAVNNENIGQQHHQRSSRPLSTYSIPSNSSYIRSTVNSSSNGQQASSSSRTLLLIESISREIGLECFLDSENSNLLMIGGRRMVIDIEIVDNGKEKGINSGAVVGTISGGEVGVGVGSSSSGSGSGSSAGVGRIKSKFSYSIDDDDDQKRDKYLDHQLEVLLSNVHQRMVRLLESSDDHNNNGQSDVKSDRRVEDLRLIQELSISLEAFSTCLRQLKFIDELIDNESTSEQKNQLQNSSNPSKVDYFWTYRDLINNYHSLTLRKIKNVDLLTKLPRTGLPLTSEDQFQLELVYHYNTSSILKNSIIDLISTKKRSGYNLMITLSSSSKDLETLEEEYDGLGELGTRGCFFAKFEPSLCVNRLTGYEIWKTSTRINLSKNLRLRSKNCLVISTMAWRMRLSLRNF